MSNRPPDVGVFDQRLAEDKIHQSPSRLKVELDSARGVGGWVCHNDRGTVINAHQRLSGVNDAHMRATGDSVVEGLEEGCQSSVTKVVAFVVGEQAEAEGTERRKGVLGFFEGGVVVGEGHDSEEVEPIGETSLELSEPLVQQTSKTNGVSFISVEDCGTRC